MLTLDWHNSPVSHFSRPCQAPGKPKRCTSQDMPPCILSEDMPYGVVQSRAVGPGPTPQLFMSPPPTVESFKVPEDFQELVEQQRIGTTTRLHTQTDFPIQAYEPKVQVPFHVLPGQCPRKTEIERYAVRTAEGSLPPKGGSICQAPGMGHCRP